MNKHLRFVIEEMMGPDFWALFLSSFTIVLMFGWRNAIKQEMFKRAQLNAKKDWY